MKNKTAWAVYNYNRLFGIELTRKSAIQETERNVGKTWKEMRSYMRVVKVTITPNVELTG